MSCKLFCTYQQFLNLLLVWCLQFFHFSLVRLVDFFYLALMNPLQFWLGQTITYIFLFFISIRSPTLACKSCKTAENMKITANCWSQSFKLQENKCKTVTYYIENTYPMYKIIFFLGDIYCEWMHNEVTDSYSKDSVKTLVL